MTLKFPKTDKIHWDLADIRGLVVISMVAITVYILHLTATHPGLANNELFKDICKNLTGVGGFGLILMFLFGGSKASAEASTAINDIAKKSTPDQSTTTTVTVPTSTATQVTTTPNPKEQNDGLQDAGSNEPGQN